MGNHSYYEFLSEISMSCPEHSISKHSSQFSSSYILSSCSSHVFPEPWEQGECTEEPIVRCKGNSYSVTAARKDSRKGEGLKCTSGTLGAIIFSAGRIYDLSLLISEGSFYLHLIVFASMKFIVLLFLLLINQMPNKKQLNGGKFIFGLWFQGIQSIVVAGGILARAGSG